MSQYAYLLIAGIVFLLIALGHLLRIVFGVAFVVHEIPVPMWASGIAVILMGFLAYESFQFARTAHLRQ